MFVNKIKKLILMILRVFLKFCINLVLVLFCLVSKNKMRVALEKFEKIYHMHRWFSINSIIVFLPFPFPFLFFNPFMMSW